MISGRDFFETAYAVVHCYMTGWKSSVAALSKRGNCRPDYLLVFDI